MAVPGRDATQGGLFLTFKRGGRSAKWKQESEAMANRIMLKRKEFLGSLLVDGNGGKNFIVADRS